jgi:integrase
VTACVHALLAGIRGNGAENSLNGITYSFPADSGRVGVCGLKGKRDYVTVALLVDCALRRNELAELEIETIQRREGRRFGRRPLY